MLNEKARYKNVMLVDDSEIDNFINQKMIEGAGFSQTIYVHTSGKSALEFLGNLSRMQPNVGGDELFPDYLFVDISMPIMDGFQFLDEFEVLYKKMLKKTKVVILTSSMSPIDQERANHYPFISAFLNKPLTVDQLNSI